MQTCLFHGTPVIGEGIGGYVTSHPLSDNGYAEKLSGSLRPIFLHV
jgi:hypothetical protein